MGDFAIPTTFKALDEALYEDGGAGSAFLGRRLIRNDRILHAHLRRCVAAEAFRPLTAVGFRDANLITGYARTPRYAWEVTQGRRYVAYYVRLSFPVGGATVQLMPETSQLSRWQAEPLAPDGYRQAATRGAAGEQTFGPFLAPVLGPTEAFCLHLQVDPPVDPHDAGAMAATSGAVVNLGPAYVEGSAGCFAGATPYLSFIRLVEGGTKAPLTLFRQITAVDNASTRAVIAQAWGWVEQPIDDIGSVAVEWEYYTVPEVRLVSLSVYEAALTTEDEIAR